MHHTATLRAIFLLLFLSLLGACGGSGLKTDNTYATKVGDRYYNKPGDSPIKGKLFGSGGGILKGGKSKSGDGTGIGVNGYLWRASLDTVSFMPLKSADPFGGLIITDWYINENTPNERFKMTVYILDRRLRADAIRVSVFRQRQSRGRWRDVPASKTTARQIENQILTRARQLRISHLGG